MHRIRLALTILVTTSLSALSAAPALAAPPSAPSALWTDSTPKKAKPLVAMPSLAPIVARVEPAVLVVFTEGPASSEGLPPGHPPMGPRLPPGHPSPGGPGGPGGPDGGAPDEVMRGQGSGFLIRADGYALTNHHVVEDATRVWVSVGVDHDEIPCDVIGSDEKSDVAVLKLRSDRTTWPTLKLADSDAVAVGDIVVAIGSPFGLEQSVSMGIVSARGRRDINPSGRQGLYDFLQTDASINPGNSGGPLLDVHGAVVGINSAINAAGAGIGFAIPINQVKRMLPSMVETGRYQRSWIGVSIGSLSPVVAKGLGVSSTKGALVREVVPGGPGAVAGLLPGDVIVKFNGRTVHEASELPLLAGDAGIGAKVALDVVRATKPLAVPLLLTGHPDNAAKTTSSSSPAPSGDGPSQPTPTPPKDASIGIAVVTLDAEQRARLELPNETVGARVSRLRPGSTAFFAGLAVDDVIVAVNGAPVATAEAFAEAVKATPSGGVLQVLLRRRASTVFAAIEKP